jgi:hypothetical protein
LQETDRFVGNGALRAAPAGNAALNDTWRPAKPQPLDAMIGAAGPPSSPQWLLNSIAYNWLHVPNIRSYQLLHDF